MKNFKINPLEVFQARKVEFPPFDFDYTNITSTYNLENAIDKWIKKNLTGRYYIGKTVELNQEDKLEIYTKVGFEKKKELSYFLLACPHLKYKK